MRTALEHLGHLGGRTLRPDLRSSVELLHRLVLPIAAPATQFGAPGPSNAAQCEGSARCGLCKSGIFRTPTAILRGADCPTLCAKTSMVTLRVIAAFEWAYPLSALCAKCTVRSYETSLGLRLRRLATALTVPT
jgi:hypothetical protein